MSPAAVAEAAAVARHSDALVRLALRKAAKIDYAKGFAPKVSPTPPS